MRPSFSASARRASATPPAGEGLFASAVTSTAAAAAAAAAGRGGEGGAGRCRWRGQAVVLLPAVVGGVDVREGGVEARGGFGFGVGGGPGAGEGGETGLGGGNEEGFCCCCCCSGWDGAVFVVDGKGIAVRR